LLEGKGITKKFGGIVALNQVDFRVESGSIFGLIGPNGSGKTTLFNVICGFYKPDGGEVMFEGRRITGYPPHKICRVGIARTFQQVKPFMNMKVLDNVLIALQHGRKSVNGKEARQAAALQLLELLKLEDKSDVESKKLTLAERKRLEIARALATGPKMLLLDEYMAGLNPTEVDEAIHLLRSIRNRFDVTIFIIEHVLRAVMNLCERVMVLNHGVKIAEGTPTEITRNTEVIKAYLGERYVA
jgi:branched-chain amino acid transport system ATP-binding protein